jgi:hypothetical protein
MQVWIPPFCLRLQYMHTYFPLYTNLLAISIVGRSSAVVD